MFKEARRQRRRRWALGATLIVVASLVLGVLLFTWSATPRSETHPHANFSRLPATDGAHRLPGNYVAGDGTGGVGVYSTATGSLIRTLSTPSPGGPDGQVVLSADRQSVFFAQPSGTCGGNILRVPTSGAGTPKTVVSVPGTLAVSPSPSPTSSELAWIGVACEPNGAAGGSSLYLTDLTSGSTSDLGAISATSSDDEIGWSPDGTHIGVENSGTVTIFVRQAQSFDKSLSLRRPNNCTLTSPAFRARRYEVAVISSCYGDAASHADRVIVFDASTGKQIGTLATRRSAQSSKDSRSTLRGGTPFWELFATIPGAELARIDGTRLVTVSRTSVTDADW